MQALGWERWKVQYVGGVRRELFGGWLEEEGERDCGDCHEYTRNYYRSEVVVIIFVYTKSVVFDQKTIGKVQ